MHTLVVVVQLASAEIISNSIAVAKMSKMMALGVLVSLLLAPPLSSSFSIQSSSYDKAWRSGVSKNPDAVAAVRGLCASVPRRAPDTTIGESGLAFLFVSQRCADSFPDAVTAAHEILGPDTTILSCVGGGVIGDGTEVDDPTIPAVSLLSGILPNDARIEVFMFGPDEAPPPPSSKAWEALGHSQSLPSYIVLGDPWSPIDKILQGLDGSGTEGAVVAGGISCPDFNKSSPTVAINGKTYPRGSAVGIGFAGRIGLQTAVAQGCRPVGPAFGVTDAQDNAIVELDGEPAMEQLRKISKGDSLSKEDRALVEANGLMCGLAAPGTHSIEKGDYLVRQILGFSLPSILLGVQEVKRGDIMRFHVRDSAAAIEDLQNMVSRARTERMFVGPERAGVPLAAMQVSCVARGRSLFGDSNVDISAINGLVGDEGGGKEEAAVAGFFANGEIGPVGIAGVGLGAKKTHMHGFTAVAGGICDFGPTDGTNTRSKEGADEGRVPSPGDRGDAADAWG